jgi:hypothetical protein
VDDDRVDADVFEQDDVEGEIFCSSTSTMAWPPYLMTTVLPKNFRI